MGRERYEVSSGLAEETEYSFRNPVVVSVPLLITNSPRAKLGADSGGPAVGGRAQQRLPLAYFMAMPLRGWRAFQRYIRPSVYRFCRNPVTDFNADRPTFLRIIGPEAGHLRRFEIQPAWVLDCYIVAMVV